MVTFVIDLDNKCK